MEEEIVKRYFPSRSEKDIMRMKTAITAFDQHVKSKMDGVLESAKVARIIEKTPQLSDGLDEFLLRLAESPEERCLYFDSLIKSRETVVGKIKEFMEEFLEETNKKEEIRFTKKWAKRLQNPTVVIRMGDTQRKMLGFYVKKITEFETRRWKKSIEAIQGLKKELEESVYQNRSHDVSEDDAKVVKEEERRKLQQELLKEVATAEAEALRAHLKIDNFTHEFGKNLLSSMKDRKEQLQDFQFRKFQSNVIKEKRDEKLFKAYEGIKREKDDLQLLHGVVVEDVRPHDQNDPNYEQKNDALDELRTKLVGATFLKGVASIVHLGGSNAASVIHNFRFKLIPVEKMKEFLIKMLALQEIEVDEGSIIDISYTDSSFGASVIPNDRTIKADFYAMEVEIRNVNVDGEERDFTLVCKIVHCVPSKKEDKVTFVRGMDLLQPPSAFTTITSLRFIDHVCIPTNDVHATIVRRVNNDGEIVFLKLARSVKSRRNTLVFPFPKHSKETFHSGYPQLITIENVKCFLHSHPQLFKVLSRKVLLEEKVVHEDMTDVFWALISEEVVDFCSLSILKRVLSELMQNKNNRVINIFQEEFPVKSIRKENDAIVDFEIIFKKILEFFREKITHERIVSYGDLDQNKGATMKSVRKDIQRGERLMKTSKGVNDELANIGMFNKNDPKKRDKELKKVLVKFQLEKKSLKAKSPLDPSIQRDLESKISSIRIRDDRTELETRRMLYGVTWNTACSCLSFGGSSGGNLFPYHQDISEFTPYLSLGLLKSGSVFVLCNFYAEWDNSNLNYYNQRVFPEVKRWLKNEWEPINGKKVAIMSKIIKLCEETIKKKLFGFISNPILEQVVDIKMF